MMIFIFSRLIVEECIKILLIFVKILKLVK
jgi:hypothetical protein